MKKGGQGKSMITQIEIDGFKTFKDFKVELALFQVIVGPNGSGKSNLFDALQLLSRLAETDLLSAFQGLRGDAGEVFTKFSQGQTSDRIRIAVEMLVDRKVRDDLGREFELEHVRLRYELEIIQKIDEQGLDQLDIVHESLSVVPRQGDRWCKRYKVDLQNDELPETLGPIYRFFPQEDGGDQHFKYLRPIRRSYILHLLCCAYLKKSACS